MNANNLRYNETCGFYALTPFDSTDPLSKKFQSDHGEAAVAYRGHLINSWNISNPAYHKFFERDESRIFAETGLASTDENYLAKKIESQTDTIASRLNSGTVAVQVIVEGYQNFYDQLSQELSRDARVHYEVPEGWNRTKNITGIVVDTQKFTVLESSVITVEYKESGRDCTLRVPYVHLQDIISDHEFAVAGVHLPGDSSQYPQGGLAELAGVVNTIWEKTGKGTVLAIGDFNTTPQMAKNHFDQVFAPDYLTHANPRFPAAGTYDFTVVKPSGGEKKTFVGAVPLESKAISDSTRALAEGLQKNLIV